MLATWLRFALSECYIIPSLHLLARTGMRRHYSKAVFGFPAPFKWYCLKSEFLYRLHSMDLFTVAHMSCRRLKRFKQQGAEAALYLDTLSKVLLHNLFNIGTTRLKVRTNNLVSRAVKGGNGGAEGCARKALAVATAHHALMINEARRMYCHYGHTILTN
jgi:hypothetical protein